MPSHLPREISFCQNIDSLPQGVMAPICRTPDCEHSALEDSLGFCSACRRLYAGRRALAAELCGALFEQYPELFARLTRAAGRQLAEHLVAHASEGESGFYARFWAGIDLVRETGELRIRRGSARHAIADRRRLRGASA